MIDIIEIADNIDFIIGEYAFSRLEDGVVIVNINNPKHTLVLAENGEILETTMDDDEIEIVKDSYRKIKKPMVKEMSDEDWLKWTSENVPTVKYKDCCTGKIYEINPKIDNTFWDTYYKRGFSSGDFILLDGELPDKWKGKSHHKIFKKNVKL